MYLKPWKAEACFGAKSYVRTRHTHSWSLANPRLEQLRIDWFQVRHFTHWAILLHEVARAKRQRTWCYSLCLPTWQAKTISWGSPCGSCVVSLFTGFHEMWEMSKPCKLCYCSGVSVRCHSAPGWSKLTISDRWSYLDNSILEPKWQLLDFRTGVTFEAVSELVSTPNTAQWVESHAVSTYYLSGGVFTVGSKTGVLNSLSKLCRSFREGHHLGAKNSFFRTLLGLLEQNVPKILLFPLAK